MANEAYFIVQRKYFHVLMKVLSFFIAFSTIFYSIKTERLKPLFKAAAVVAIILTLGNAG